jgi:regulatory protein
MNLLARREHSIRELRRKLQGRGYRAETVDEVLAELVSGGLASDLRYTESYIRSRCERGYGPVRIRAELRQRGVAGELIEQVLAAEDSDWPGRIRAVHRAKFGGARPRELKERARQVRFLQYRGFTMGQIDDLFNDF